MTGLYYGVSICLVSFASALSVVTLNLHHRGLRGTEVPYILRRIILDGLGRLVFLRFDVPKTFNKESNGSSSEKADTKTADHRCNCKKESSRNAPHKSCNHVSAARASTWYVPSFLSAISIFILFDVSWTNDVSLSAIFTELSFCQIDNRAVPKMPKR